MLESSVDIRTNAACLLRRNKDSVLFFQGCRAPLVVKFADTQKDKEMKKLQQMNANLISNLAGLGNATPQYLTVSIGKFTHQKT